MAVTAMRDDVTRFERGLVLDAAAHLFFERGYALSTTEALAERLSVSKTKIYTLFKSKTEILDTICETTVERSLDLVEEIAGAKLDPVAKIRSLARDLTCIVLECREAIAIGGREISHLSEPGRARIVAKQGRFDRLLAGIIDEGCQAGVFDVADPAQTALAISGMIIFAHGWYRPSGRLGPEAIAEGMAEAALRLVLAGTRDLARQAAA